MAKKVGMYRAVRGGHCMLHFHDGAEHITSPVDDEMILFSDDSTSVVEDWINAYRLVNPDVVIYLCDHNNQVYQHFYDNPAKDARGKHRDRVAFLKGLGIILALNVIVTTIFGYARLSHKPLWLFVLVAAPCLFYIGTVKTRVTNAVEGIVVSTILTIVIWCILPTLLRYLKM